MGKQGNESVETRKFKDAFLGEIFNAYQESGTVYQKTTDLEIRQTVLDLKRCYDLAITICRRWVFTRRNSGRNWGRGFRIDAAGPAAKTDA